ncbi:MAG TPA: response regulator transcription factor [Longimicrobiales bacterium]
MSHTISVAVVTDVRLYRDALEQILRSCDAIHVHDFTAGTTSNLDWLKEVRPCIVLADGALVCETDFVTRVRAAQSDTRVIAFGVPENETDVLACARAGAHGIVLRSASSGELIDVVLGVHRGELPCSPRLGALLFAALAQLPERSDAAATALTSRETEVLSLIEQGCSNKEIARRLFIGIPTAKNHVHNILEKLGVPRRSAAIAALHQRKLKSGT